VIAFGSAITKPAAFREQALRGIEMAREADTIVIEQSTPGSIFQNYNRVLESASELEDLEALVLLHQDAEIQDRAFLSKLRAVLADPDVGVVGCVGSLGVRTIAWWEGSVSWASFIHRYTELDGGDFPSVSWNESDRAPYAHLGEVDTVDGFVLALSPWVVRNIRFDESLGQQLHGYDFDFCLQVREAGRKIMTADFKMIHNHSLELANDLEHWSEAHVAVSEKWDGRMPDIGTAPGTWRERARRGEAEAAITRAGAISTELKIRAIRMQHEREMELMTSSLGWRLTAPLRLLSAARRHGATLREGAALRPSRVDATRSFNPETGERERVVPTVLGRRLAGGVRLRRRTHD
jgi:hypothetical protein